MTSALGPHPFAQDGHWHEEIGERLQYGRGIRPKRAPEVVPHRCERSRQVAAGLEPDALIGGFLCEQVLERAQGDYILQASRLELRRRSHYIADRDALAAAERNDQCRTHLGQRRVRICKPGDCTQPRSRIVLDVLELRMNAVPVLLEHPVHEIDGSSYPDNAVHANRSPPEEDRDANVLRPPEQIARKRVHLEPIRRHRCDGYLADRTRGATAGGALERQELRIVFEVRPARSLRVDLGQKCSDLRVIEDHV